MAQLLVDSVLQATREGRLRWQRDPLAYAAASGPAREDARKRLVASLEQTGERLWLELLPAETYEDDPTVLDGWPRVLSAALLVRDETGEVVRRVEEDELESCDRGKLAELYEAALASARGPQEVDVKVAEVLSRLPAASGP